MNLSQVSEVIQARNMEDDLRRALMAVIDPEVNLPSLGSTNEIIDVLAGVFQRKAWKYQDKDPATASCYQFVAAKLYDLASAYEDEQREDGSFDVPIESLDKFNQDHGYEYTPDTIDRWIDDG